MRRLICIGLVLLALAGCASRPPLARGESEADTTCVPYARARSGLALRGDAWQWWEAAAGQYRRDRRPRPGAVLVLMRTARLPSGHVAVVSRLVSTREIRVDHANWASGRAKGRIARDQQVVDVSEANDWSLVRVFYPRTQELGATNYPAYGFVHPEQSYAEATGTLR